MKKGQLSANMIMLISVIMLLLVFAFLWTAQDSAQSIISPTIEEAPIIAGAILMRRSK